MITVKTICYKDGLKMIKRTPMSRLPGELTFDELSVMIARLYSVSEFLLSYQDDDSDLVELNSTEDITHALSLSSTLKVHVFLDGVRKTPNERTIDMIYDLKAKVDQLNEAVKKLEVGSKVEKPATQQSVKANPAPTPTTSTPAPSSTSAPPSNPSQNYYGYQQPTQPPPTSPTPSQATAYSQPPQQPSQQPYGYYPNQNQNQQQQYGTYPPGPAGQPYPAAGTSSPYNPATAQQPSYSGTQRPPYPAASGYPGAQQQYPYPQSQQPYSSSTLPPPTQFRP
jgi:hypothetical protein